MGFLLEFMASRVVIGPRNFNDAVSRMKICHSQELEPVCREVTRRQSSFEFVERDSNSRGLGFFHELVTKGLYGGELSKHIRHFQGKTLRHLMPDVVDSNRKKIGEVKARKNPGKFNIRDDQIEKYSALQVINQDCDVYFALYLSTFGLIRNFGGTQDELFKELSDKIQCSIVLPFSLVTELHSRENSDLTCRFEGGDRKRYDKATTLSAYCLTQLFYRSEGIIERLDLSPEDYIIERFISPGEFSVENSSVKQFPILRISDKGHEKWIKQFLSSS